MVEAISRDGWRLSPASRYELIPSAFSECQCTLSLIDGTIRRFFVLMPCTRYISNQPACIIRNSHYILSDSVIVCACACVSGCSSVLVRAYSTSIWRPRWRWPRRNIAEIFDIRKLRVSGLSYGVVLLILRLAVLTQYRRVTDGRTDRHRTTADSQSPSTIESRDTRPRRMQEVNSLCTDSRALRAKYCIVCIPHNTAMQYIQL